MEAVLQGFGVEVLGLRIRVSRESLDFLMFNIEDAWS